MKKNQYIHEKPYKLHITWLIVIFCILLLLSTFYVSYVKELVYQNIYQNITELSEQTATQLNLSITDQKSFVNIMIESIKNGYFKTPEQIFERYQNDLESYHFTRLVILDKRGNGTTSDGHIVTNYPNIEEFFREEDDVYVSENRPSTVTNNQVNIYSKNFTLNGEEKVLMATINTSDYKDILLRRLFGKGGTYLINSKGHVLIDSFDNIKEGEKDLYEHLKISHNAKNPTEIQKIDDMANAIKNKQVGTFDVKLGQEVYFIHYEKVGINDWYVVTTAADEIIGNELIRLVLISVGLCLLVNLVIIGITIYIDISNQKKNHKLYKTAYIDPVTMLGNEAYFKENGIIYLQENKSIKNKYIVTLDINKFKALNNIYGYVFCNQILKLVGQILASNVPKNNITCRISNDIFATIFSYEDDICELLDKIYNRVSTLKIDNMDIHMKLAIGAYKIKPNEMDINKLLDKAHMARNEIKGKYHNNYYLFDETLENELIEEQQIESYMEEALEKKEFKVVYQPKTYTKNEKLAGAEALIRWYKDGKIIPPNKFIPLFEKNKFIIKLDLYIFDQVCQDLAKWREEYNYMPTISINVSKEHFANENFIDEYVTICEKYGLETSSIDLEITESATIDQNIDILEVLNKIKEKGFIVSIDDFGTGYSSLSMLQSMPIDIIKIDKVFVDKADLLSTNNIINYIMFIAGRLGVKTIIEGVETKEQVDFIKDIKGDIIQGYYYSKPISKDEFEKYFNENK